MAGFLVAVSTPRLDQVALENLAVRLEAAVEARSEEGSRVRYLRTIHVPEDETCFHLFKSESAEAVREVGQCAGPVFDRITPAIESIRSGEAR